jgi:hypothetical protein
MNRLEKIRIPHIITSPNSSNSKNYTEIHWGKTIQEFIIFRIKNGSEKIRYFHDKFS